MLNIIEFGPVICGGWHFSHMC